MGRVGILTTLLGSPAATLPAGDPVMVAPPTPAVGVGVGFATITDTISTAQAERVAVNLIESIPSVRKAMAVIAGTIGTFGLGVWDAAGTRLPATDPRGAWLTQPDPRRTLQWILTKTVRDLVWRDTCVWRITDRTLYRAPVAATRIHPNRIQRVDDPLDPDTVRTWIIDGTEYAAGHPDLIVFDAAGLGGLTRYGLPLLTLYGQLQAAAGRYAEAPHPHAVLKNSGADLEDAEIDALLTKWDTFRASRGIAYTNSVLDYVGVGYSAKELQLVEAREHAALETARLFGLPAKSLDAKSGDPMTYGNVVEWRREEVKAIRPWMTAIDQTLSLVDRSGPPRGVAVPAPLSVRLDPADYLREDTKTRMETWGLALTSGVLTLDEVRSNEPLATGVKA